MAEGQGLRSCLCVADADGLEFQRRDLKGAAAAYRKLAESKEPAVRAAALNRLGRVLRKREGKRAVLYELVTAATSEEHTSDRRREHGAYR